MSRISDRDLYGLVGQVAEDVFDAQPVRQSETIEQLLHEFSERSGDIRDEAMVWFKDTHPWLYKALTESPPDLFERGGDRVKGEIDRIAKRVDDHRSGSLWSKAGFSPMYDDLARQLHGAPDWKFIREIDGQLRFALPASAWRDIIEGFAGRTISDDIVDIMKKLGIAHPDVKGEARFTLWTRGDEVVHIPPKDAALFLDSLLLRRRGTVLHPDGHWVFARRDDIPGVGNGLNCFVMPVDAYLGMRGLAQGYEELAAQNGSAKKGDLILQATRDRLIRRGVENPSAALVQRDGKECIILTTEQARVLLKPADPGQAELARHRLEYDPKAVDYDENVAMLCIQAQSLAYAEAATVESYAKAWGWEGATLLADANTSAEMLVGYDVERNAIILAPRGTQERADVGVDANVSRVDASHLVGKGRGHGGVVQQTDALLPQFDAKFREYQAKLADYRREKGLPAETPAILMGGHSLGGGVATMILGYLLHRDLKVNSIYTCGQLRTGDEVFCNHVAEMVKKHRTVFVRFVNNDDPVVEMPPNCQHKPLGFEIFIDEFGRMCPQNQPRPDGSLPHADDLLSRITRTIKHVREAVNDHRLGSYQMLFTKAIGSFRCSVWE